MSADAGEIVVCNAVFRLSITCSVPDIFAIYYSFFKIAPISDHVVNFRGDRPRDRGDLALKKKRKKEKKRNKQQQNIRAAVALSQRAALIKRERRITTHISFYNNVMAYNESS